MIDFLLTDKGDLVIEEAEVASIFKLNFRLSEHNDFKLLFHIGPQQNIVTQAPFKMTFKMGKEESCSKVSTVDGLALKAQQIRLALSTERGELPNIKDFGSRLYLFKHESIFLEENLRKIEASVKEALRHISEEITATARPEKGTGSFYAQTIGIYIYESSRLVFEFQL